MTVRFEDAAADKQDPQFSGEADGDVGIRFQCPLSQYHAASVQSSGGAHLTQRSCCPIWQAACLQRTKWTFSYCSNVYSWRAPDYLLFLLYLVPSVIQRLFPECFEQFILAKPGSWKSASIRPVSPVSLIHEQFEDPKAHVCEWKTWHRIAGPR